MNSTRMELMFNEADEVEIRIPLSVSAIGAGLDAVSHVAREMHSELFLCDPATRALLQPNASLRFVPAHPSRRIDSSC